MLERVTSNIDNGDLCQSFFGLLYRVVHWRDYNARTHTHTNAKIIYDPVLWVFLASSFFFFFSIVLGGSRRLAANSTAFPVILLPLQNTKSPVPSPVNNGGHNNGSLLCALSHFFGTQRLSNKSSGAPSHIWMQRRNVFCSFLRCSLLGCRASEKVFCMRVSRHNEFKLLKMLQV